MKELSNDRKMVENTKTYAVSTCIVKNSPLKYALKQVTIVFSIRIIMRSALCGKQSSADFVNHLRNSLACCFVFRHNITVKPRKSEHNFDL